MPTARSRWDRAGCSAGGRSSRFGGSADRQQVASRHHAGCAVAPLVAGQERVEAVTAAGARQVVREVLLVLVDRVPHWTFTSSTYPGSHPWSLSTSVGAGRTAANGPRGPCGGTESHQWSRSPAAAAREEGARLAAARGQTWTVMDQGDARCADLCAVTPASCGLSLTAYDVAAVRLPACGWPGGRRTTGTAPTSTARRPGSLSGGR